MQADRSFRAAFAAFRRRLGAVLLFSGVIGLLLFSVPLFSLQVYDRVLVSRHESTLVVLAAMTILCLLVLGYLDRIRARLVARYALRLEADLSADLFEQCRSAELILPDSKGAMALADARKLREFLSGNGLVALSELPVAPVLLLVCFLFHPLLGAVAVAGAALLLMIAFAAERTSGELIRQAQLDEATERRNDLTLLEETATLKALGMGSVAQALHQQGQAVAMKAAVDTADATSTMMALQKTVRFSLQVATMGTGALLVIQGSISPGMLIASSILVTRAVAPLDQLGMVWKQLIAARIAFRRLERLFLQPIPEAGSGVRPAGAAGELAAERVALAVPGSQTVLSRGVDFRLQRGEVLFVTGATGSGKSTLLQAICGAAPLLDGAIAVGDGEGAAKPIGYLPQQLQLLPGTVEENVTRFAPSTPQALQSALTLSGAAAVISTLPSGPATRVPDEVPHLSPGTLRRIGLARAFHGTPALVVLDEPTAFLDPSGRAALFDSIRALKRAGATIVIASSEPGLQGLSDWTLQLTFGGVARCQRTKTIAQRSAAAPQQAGQAA